MSWSVVEWLRGNPDRDVVVKCRGCAVNCAKRHFDISNGTVAYSTITVCPKCLLTYDCRFDTYVEFSNTTRWNKILHTLSRGYELPLSRRGDIELRKI